MKKYKYVVVNGCSLSVDPPHNSADLGIPKDGKSYGKLISKHYGAKCYDLTNCGNSMQGTHRRILDWCGKNTDKFEDTLIIVGVTITGRVEIWNNKYNDGGGLHWHSDTEYFQPPRSLLDKFKDRLLIYWPPEQRKNYWINFHNENAEFFLMTQNIIGLQSFLTLNNIDHVFFDAMGPLNKYWENTCDDKEDKFGHKLLFDNLVTYENWYKHPKWDSLLDLTESEIEMRIGPTDLGEDFHPNKKAHKYWGECLIEYINEKINI